MSRFSLKRLPSPAMAVAFIALLATLSGTAIALPGKNTVDSGDIKKGAVRGKDIRKNAVTGKKVKNNSLTGSDVKSLTGGDVNDNSLGGNDVDETSLAKVPSAAAADTAQSAGSAATTASLVTFNVGMNRGDARRQVAKVGPVTLYGRCEEAAGSIHAYLEAETSLNDTYTDNDNDLDVGEIASVDDLTSLPTSADFTSVEPDFWHPTAGGSFEDDGESVGILVAYPGAECRFFGTVPVIPAA